MENESTTTTKKSNSKKGKSEPPPPFHVPAEELTPEQTGAIDLHLKGPEDLSTIIKNEVQKFDAGFIVPALDEKKQKLSPEKKIELLKKLYTGLTIGGVDDKENYLKVDEARKLLMRLRTGVDKKHKDLKANYLAVGKALDQKKNTLTDLLLEIETPLKNEIQRIDDLKAEAERKAEQERQQKLQGRVDEIKAAGMTFDGSFYSIGETLSVDIVVLGAIPDDKFTEFVDRIKAEKSRLDFIQYKNNQRDRVEKYLFLRRQRKQLEEETKLNEEREQLKKEIAASRIEYLLNKGFEVSADGSLYYYKNIINLSYGYLKEIGREGWETQKAEIKTKIDTLNQQEEETKKQQAITDRHNARFKAMADLGYSFDKVSGQFFIFSPELGETNYFSRERVLEDLPDFEKWFKEIATVDAAETFKKIEGIREGKIKLAQRTRLRVGEVMTSFGMDPVADGYMKFSPLRNEPELTGVDPLAVTLKQIEEADEDVWTEITKGLVSKLSNIQHAEAKAKDRKSEEAETERLALLSEADQVKEYISKLNAVKVPEVKDPGFKLIVDNIGAELNTAVTRLELVKPD